ncbi:Pyruvate/Phosphoenolpyruvate kinase-like domain-containing protein [Pelagophyceae sp. CCMP2097]|nr:Pyruvate/Phosphoenolpyruvate kinase-like domain-containing protein [Pelagophyceae sp. CCMP2097]
MEAPRRRHDAQVILDLEDSVAHSHKPEARQLLAAWLSDGEAQGKEVIVRIGPLGGGSWVDDLDALFQHAAARRARGKGPGFDGIMVPKVHSHRCLDALAAALRSYEGEDEAVPFLPIATESAEGLLNIRDIAAHSRVSAVAWGAEDLAVDVGATRKYGESGRYLPLFEFARLQCLLAAKAAKVQCLDGVYTDVRDAAGLASEAADATAMGFDGKLALHPGQLAATNAAFTPTQKQRDRAHKVVAALDGAAGVALVDGEMVDLPHLRAAERLLARARAVDAKAGTFAVSAAPEAPHSGKWFEDLEEGLVFQHAIRRTITETDNVLATALSLNPASLHLDYHYAATTQFRRPLVNSMFTLSLLVGISVHETTHGTAVANLGFESVKFPAPLFHGDTIRCETTVVSKRKSQSNPTQGIVVFEHRAYNCNDGKLVASCVRSTLVRCRPM